MLPLYLSLVLVNDLLADAIEISLLNDRDLGVVLLTDGELGSNIFELGRGDDRGVWSLGHGNSFLPGGYNHKNELDKRLINYLDGFYFVTFSHVTYFGKGTCRVCPA